MRRLFTTMIALAMFTFTASAQFGGGQPPQRQTPAQVTDRMTEQLGLTDEQKGKVLELNTEYEDIVGFGGFGGGFPGGGPAGPPPQGFGGGGFGGGGDFGNGGGFGGGGFQPPELTEEQKAKFAEMRQKREDYNAKLKEILTEEQYAKYEKNRQRGPGGHRPDKNKDKNKDKDKKKDK